MLGSPGCSTIPDARPPSLVDGAALEDSGAPAPPDPNVCGPDDAAAVGPADGDASIAQPETGRLAGITAAHNAARALVVTQPPLSPLTWCPTIAAYAQDWANTLATTMCAQPLVHRAATDLQAKGYGENIATFAGGGLFGPISSTAAQAVNGWASEAACWTYGTIGGTAACDVACYTNLNSDGCGHYTQLIWRDTSELGCGVATCQNGAASVDIWVCNYAPPGNYPGLVPY
jgi:pathogenesis-related protein 1